MDKHVRSYFKTVPARRKGMIEKLHSAVVECFPGVKIDMKYKMPTYSYGNGWVAIANKKNYISLYTCGAYHLEKFKAAHTGIKTGKGCINFRENDEFPLEAIKEVIKRAINHPKGKQP